MRFIVLLLPFIAAPGVLGAPIASFRDIERRWIEGQSEKQIHDAHDIREATPAWNVKRSAGADSGFTYSTDERTMQENVADKREDKLLIKMKDFVKGFMASKGMDISHEVDQDSAPVLKPKRGMEYPYTA